MCTLTACKGSRGIEPLILKFEMKGSGQFYAPATSSLAKGTLTPIEQEAEWTTENALALGRRDKSLIVGRNRN